MDRVCLWVILISFFLFSCFRETAVEVNADFSIEVIDDDYSVPVKIQVRNESTGADLYEWSFEGGEPAGSNKVNPDEIVYSNPGAYTIRLEAWNTTERKVREETLVLDSAMNARFAYTVSVNNYAPVEVKFYNHSSGGSEYRWEFSGGNPAVSSERVPPPVVFREPGLHAVSLKVSNARETVEFSDTIRVLPSLSVDFDWEPGVDDADMEAPFTACLTAKCTGAESYRWIAEGGQIGNDTLPETDVFFAEAGTYSIELQAFNGKETKSREKKIVVLENSNLYILRDLKMGITTALETIGAYYSSGSRSVLSAGQLTAGNGQSVDLVFWGLDGLEQCCFLSPDAAGQKALPEVPGARHTWLINRPAAFTGSDFDRMENDEVLRQMNIRENSDRDENIYFTGDEIPHCVLFETSDHRKGAVKVKGFVRAGRQSYIIADIKIQKQSR